MPEMISGVALYSLLAATVLQALDLTIATIALPAIEGPLGLDFESGAWILTSYLVALALMTPVAGTLSAAIGRRNALLSAIAGLTLASAACGAAQDFSFLLAARLAQGAAAGLIMPLVQATLLDMSPKSQHGRAMSLFGAAIMVGPVLGPSIGGLLVDTFGWRSVFFINLPIGLLAFLGTARALRELPKSAPRHLDARGLAIFGCGIVALQLLLDRGPHIGWLASRETLSYGVVAAGSLGVAVLRSALVPYAFPSLAPFRDRNFLVTTVCSFLAGFVILGTIFLVPSLLQNVFGRGASAAGLAVAPRGAGTMFMMLVMSRKVGTVDHRVLLLAGVALNVVALAGFTQVTARWDLLAVAGLSLVQGIGFGLIFTPLSTAAFSFLRPELRADATGIYSLLRNVGGGVGVSVLTALLFQQVMASPRLFAAYQFDFLVLIAVFGMMGAATLLIRTDVASKALQPGPGGLETPLDAVGSTASDPSREGS
jgi:DHA2 family multidrug resistance protein